jgi:hypothetical protein
VLHSAVWPCAKQAKGRVKPRLYLDLKIAGCIFLAAEVFLFFNQAPCHCSPRGALKSGAESGVCNIKTNLRAVAFKVQAIPTRVFGAVQLLAQKARVAANQT